MVVYKSASLFSLSMSSSGERAKQALRPQSLAQPRWWVWGGSLEGNQRRAHQTSPQAPALSPDLPDSPSVSPELPSPSPRPGGDPCPHERRELGPETDSPACTWVLRPTLSPGRERPVRGVPSALSSTSPPGESPGPWGPLMEQAGWGVPPDQGSPCPSHLTKAEQGRERVVSLS